MGSASEISDNAAVQMGERTSSKRVQSFLDKLNDVTMNPDGTVTHNIYKKNDKPREFKNVETF